MKNILFLLTGFSLLLFTALLQAASDPVPLSTLEKRSWENPAYVEKAFVEIAFKREYETSPPLHTLNRWKVPIYYQIHYYHFDPDGFKQTLETPVHQVFRQLARITGHPIQPADRAHPPNFIVTLTRSRSYAKAIKTIFGQQTLRHISKNLSDTTNCVGRYIPNKKGEIYQGNVIIPVDSAFKKGQFLSCVTEEITQLMGMPNDADWVSPSLANDRNPQQEYISPLDYLFLRLLYHPALKPGMPLPQARPIMHQILTRWKHNGTLKKSPILVRRIRQQASRLAGPIPSEQPDHISLNDLP